MSRIYPDDFSDSCSVYEKEEDPLRKERLGEYKGKIQLEVEQLCTELIHLVKDILLPASSTPEITVFWQKMKADYYRYIAEMKGVL